MTGHARRRCRAAPPSSPAGLRLALATAAAVATRGGAFLALCLALAAGVLAAACGGGGATGSSPDGTANGGGAGAGADVSVLMMGNSHVAANELPQQLQAMLGAGLGGRSVAVTVAPGWMFLDERLADPASTALLRSRPWSVVVLQAQKYSASGLYSYSTQAAEQWVQMARSAGALPVMFPEWPRQAVDETDRIYQLHVSIAQRQPACVAPIGQAWDLAQQRHPTLQLHASDGNHSNAAGAFLAALVLYATASGASPKGLPDLDNGVAAQTQAWLRQVAEDTVRAFPPRRYCPADPSLVLGQAQPVQHLQPLVKGLS